MRGFFAEIGCILPTFPCVAHSPGWSAQDMENDVRHVEGSEDLREGTRALVDRCVELSRRLREQTLCPTKLAVGVEEVRPIPRHEHAQQPAPLDLGPVRPIRSRDAQDKRRGHRFGRYRRYCRNSAPDIDDIDHTAYE